MIEFITGASGTGKTTEMFGRIRDFSLRGMEQCVLVPEQYSSDFDKKLYFFLGAKQFNELLSLSFSSLARQLFQLYGEPDRKGEFAGEMTRMILIFQAVSAARSTPGALTFFSRRSGQNGFAEETSELICDMKRSGITPQSLLDRAGLLDSRLRDKTADIAAIYSEYERLMTEYGFKDNLENIREAAKIANLQQYFKGKCVCLDEFESFTGDQLEMLKVIFSSAENVVITLRSDDVGAGEFTLFETVNSTFRRLTSLCRELNRKFKVTKCEKMYRFRSPDLEYVSRRIMRSLPFEPENAPAATNVSIFEARDMYSEAEYVCARLKRLLHADSSLKYRDIAIISNDIARYSGVLKAAFARYGIPFFLSVERTVSHTAVMAFFTALLDLLTARKFRSEQIFRLLRCGLIDEELTHVSLLENYCYKWGIDGDTWCQPFSAEDGDLELLENLRRRTAEPVAMLKRKLRGTVSAREMCTHIYGYLADCGAEENLAKLMGRLIRSDRDYEAAELKRLWSCLMDILDSLADTLGDKKITFSELSAIMRSMIGRLTYSVTPQTLDAVTAASARTARLDSPRVIFVMGAAEGDFPNQVSLHGLFTEGDKQKLSLSGIEIARPLSDLIASERMIVYKALSTASERLFLTYPLSDLSGQGKYPARIVETLQKMFREKILITEGELSPDFYAVTLHAAYYHYMQDKSRKNASVASIEKLLLSDPDYSRRVASALSRSGARTDFKVDSSIMEKLINFSPLNLSATAVEKYSRCHFGYFCNYALCLREPEKMELDPMRSGDLIHNCLHDIIGSRSRAEFLKMTYEDICREIGRTSDKYREEKMGGDFSKSPRFELLYNKLKERIAGVFLHTQGALMVSKFSPDAFELDLGGSHALRLPFGVNGHLTFGGFLDRADIWEDGDKKYLRVVDYKSSIKQINKHTLAEGLNLQMLLYLFASTEKGGVYEGCVPAGVLYSPVQLSDLDTAEARVDSFNQEEFDKRMRMTGLLIDDMTVLDAMEKDIRGRYIPANVIKSGGLGAYSSVVAQENMSRLRDWVYGRLTETAESIHSGEIDAVPLFSEGKKPCKYCIYGDSCANPDGAVFRTADPERLAEAAEILGKGDKKNGLD